MVPFWIFWVTSRPYCKVMILLNVKYFISTMVQDFQWPWTTHNLDFQGHAIWRWISQKLYEIQTYLQWSTNRDLLTPYSRVSFRMTLSDLEWNIQWHDASHGLSATAELSGVGTYLSGTARAVPLLKVGRLVMHFAVPLFGHRLHIALMIDV